METVARIRNWLSISLCIASPLVGLSAPIDFDSQIAPLLAKRCLSCHVGDDASGGLDLSSRETLLSGGENGPAMRPGELDASLLWQRVVADEMPEKSPLPLDEKELLRGWVEQGGPWGSFPVLDPHQFSSDSRAGYDWWSLQPLATSPLPVVSDSTWLQNPIDAYVLAKLDAAGLAPSAPAPAATLVRRIYYDLTGLPPSPAALQGAVAQVTHNPDGVARLAESLLTSPHYGQHWARHWLDVVRFGESHGFEYNQPRDNAWHYRNWVINALNHDMPYHQFVRWQIAGDVILPEHRGALSATGFLVAGPHNTTKPSNDRMRMVMRHDELEDIVGTIGQTFLGLTVNCARCHDHKFDPITQREYFQLVATVAGIDHGDRDLPGAVTERAREAATKAREVKQHIEKLDRQYKTLIAKVTGRLPSATGEQAAAVAKDKPAEPTEVELAQLLSDQENAKRIRLQERLVTLRSRHQSLTETKPEQYYGPISTTPPPVHRLRRGDVTTPAEIVLPTGLAGVNRQLADFGLTSEATDAERRIKLAEWVTGQENVLFARVIVNRVWHYHFGQGLVRTPSDFGFNGDRPSHPELLDYLARELIRLRWQLKPLHRMIVTSATYQQSSQRRLDAEQIDADNRLLWRAEPRRLTAEEIRDSVLVVAGLLDDRHGGVGYRDVREYMYKGSHFYDPIEPQGPESVRRTVYRFSPRGAKRTILDTFDCPDPSAKAPTRASTITPLQALSLMNHYFMIDMSAACAARVTREATAEQSPVERLFIIVLGRAPTPDEQQESKEFLTQTTLADLCRVLLNSNEFLHVR